MKSKLLLIICCVFILVGCSDWFSKKTTTEDNYVDSVLKESKYDFSWMDDDDEQLYVILEGFNDSYYALKLTGTLKFFDKDGNEKWEKVVSDIQYQSIITSKGSIIIYKDMEDKLYYILHSDENGNKIWEKGPFVYAKPNHLKEKQNRFNIYVEMSDKEGYFIFDNDGKELVFLEAISLYMSGKTSDNGYLLLEKHETSSYVAKKYDENFNLEWETDIYRNINVVSYDFNNNIIVEAESSGYSSIIKYNNDGNELAYLKLPQGSYHVDVTTDNKYIYIVYYNNQKLLCIDENLNPLWEKKEIVISSHKITDSGIVIDTNDSVIKFSHEGELITEIPLDNNTEIHRILNDGIVFIKETDDKEYFYKINDDSNEVFNFNYGPNYNLNLFAELTNSYVISIKNIDDDIANIYKVTAQGNTLWEIRTTVNLLHVYEIDDKNTAIIYSKPNTPEYERFMKIVNNEGKVIYEGKILAITINEQKPIIYTGTKSEVKELEVIYNE